VKIQNWTGFCPIDTERQDLNTNEYNLISKTNKNNSNYLPPAEWKQ
jgi:hypothetical protein